MRGDETLRIKLRNMLGLNRRRVPIGPYPDPIDLPPGTTAQICRLVSGMDPDDPEEPPLCNPFFFTEELEQMIPAQWKPGHELNHHSNGLHQTHVTNLHTHGLHVEPNLNPDGSHSDDVMLRVIPHADWEARQQSPNRDELGLAPHEVVGDVDISIQLGNVWRARQQREGEPPQPHPPGTHWYHPHPHGATNDQVASGMAGFLIVEGDVDDRINLAMTGLESILN